MVNRLLNLSSLHSFGLLASCRQITNIDYLTDFSSLNKFNSDEPFWILGEGSNCVFTEDYQGTIYKVNLKGIDCQENENYFKISVAAGENWHDFVRWCLKQNIYGLENLALIPGTVGAAPIQNIGAYGVELERFIDHLEYVCLMSGEIKRLNRDQCQFGYRDSIFKKELSSRAIITKVVFALPKHWSPVSQYGELANMTAPSPRDIFNQVVKIRQAKLPDPKQVGNAGSFFKNPIIDKNVVEQLARKWPHIPQYHSTPEKVKIPAAWLIDTLGFKGKKIGGIGCHPNHALVLTNDGTGTGEQLLQLARAIKEAVLSEFSITLENEVRLIGKNGPVDL
jgi:UDP-N-acetylmuramate dehydrogenase